jgi:hypothetical protein
MSYEKHLEKLVEDISAAPEGSQIRKANPNILLGKQGQTWAGGGLLEIAGFIWWTADCNLLLTDVSTGVKAVHFEASGTGFMVGAIESELAGAFVVDPSTIGGNCHYSIAVGALEEGAVSLILYSTKGQVYGTFVGPGEGLAAGSMSGTGKLIVS